MPLLPQPVSWFGLFFAISYSKLAQVKNSKYIYEDMTRDVSDTSVVSLKDDMYDKMNSISKKDQINKTVSNFAEECGELLKFFPKLPVDKFVQSYWDHFGCTFRYRTLAIISHGLYFFTPFLQLLIL